MNTATSNNSDILSQIIQLYEFSLAVGNSSDLNENCKNFFDRILARRNLSYAALWLQNPIDEPCNEYSLSYSNPHSEYSGPDQISCESAFIQKIYKKQIFSIDREALIQQNWRDEKYLPNGESFTLINLAGLGFIILAGYGQRGLWKPWELSQFKPIFNSFAASIRSNINFKQLQKEIIERKNAEQEATKASEVKSQFLANMSHELRTPLNAVLGMSQLLEDTLLDSEQHELVSTILSSGKSLMELINDILDFSKLEAHMLKLENVHFDLHEAIQHVHQTFEKQCSKKSLQYHLDIDKKLPHYFLGDPLRVKQVLLNLISNSIKFTNQGTISITIELMSQKEDIVQIKFSINDTGIGIRKEHLKDLFKDFHQVDSSITRNFGGTGLGLSICKQIVELMQGEISVSSQIGVGSHFSFTIPLQLSVEVSDQDQANTITIDSTVKNAKILLVEDDKVNQMVAQKLLQKIGFESDIAENGLEAIEQLKHTRYDLVFMDMQMPQMGGLEATRIIRQKVSGVLDPEVTILAMTANAMESDRHLCLQAGMNDYMSKPIVREELVKKLEIWL